MFNNFNSFLYEMLDYVIIVGGWSRTEWHVMFAEV